MKHQLTGLATYLSALLVVFGCNEPIPPYSLPKNVISIICSDSIKTWKLAKRLNDGNRMNMGDCFLSYRQTFKKDMTVSDNNGDNDNCGESLTATWEIIKDEKAHSYIKMQSPQIPMLMNIKEDYKKLRILHLSENKMTVAFYHRQFSDRWTIITDYLVPESVLVEDREFHW